MPENKVCYGCGKDLSFKHGEVVGMQVGMRITASWEDSGSEEANEALKKNLGKYAPTDPNIKEVCFNFCFECLIDSLKLQGRLRYSSFK